MSKYAEEEKKIEYWYYYYYYYRLYPFVRFAYLSVSIFISMRSLMREGVRDDKKYCRYSRIWKISPTYSAAKKKDNKKKKISNQKIIK